MISDLQGRQHGTGGDLKGLNHKGSNKERKNYGNAKCLNILSDDRLFFRIFRIIHVRSSAPGDIFSKKTGEKLHEKKRKLKGTIPAQRWKQIYKISYSSKI